MYYIIYTSSAKGSIVKLVTCEKCERDYAYQMKRRSEGKSISFMGLNSNMESMRAERMATNQLERKLSKEVDQVPCPYCGWYQDEMVKFIHKTKYMTVVYTLWVLVLFLLLLSPFLSGYLLLILAFFLGGNVMQMGFPIGGFVTFLIVFSAAGVAGAFTFLRHKIAMRYNPNENESEDERIEKGRSWAISQKKFDKLFGERKLATRNKAPADHYIKGEGHVNDLEYDSNQSKRRRTGRNDDGYPLKDE